MARGPGAVLGDVGAEVAECLEDGVAGVRRDEGAGRACGERERRRWEREGKEGGGEGEAREKSGIERERNREEAIKSELEGKPVPLSARQFALARPFSCARGRGIDLDSLPRALGESKASAVPPAPRRAFDPGRSISSKKRKKARQIRLPPSPDMTGVLYIIQTTVVATISAWWPASVAAAATATEAGTGVGGRGRTGTTGRIGNVFFRPFGALARSTPLSSKAFPR